MKNKKTKKLSFQEMWNLYLLLKSAIDNRELDDLLIDEIVNLLMLSPQGTLATCLGVFYNKVDIDNLNPLEAGLFFIRGIKENDFFNFVKFVRNISNGDS